MSSPVPLLGNRSDSVEILMEWKVYVHKKDLFLPNAMKNYSTPYSTLVANDDFQKFNCNSFSIFLNVFSTFDELSFGNYGNNRKFSERNVSLFMVQWMVYKVFYKKINDKISICYNPRNIHFKDRKGLQN